MINEPYFTTFSQSLSMISSPSEDADTADVLIAVAVASVQDASGFADIERATLWELQRQTDARMVRDATRCLESACRALVMANVPNRDVYRFAQRLPPFDRVIGQWRMLVEFTVVPQRLAEAVWTLGELDAAVAVRSGAQKFRLKDLPAAQYVRLSQSLLSTLLQDRDDRLVSEDALAAVMKHSAAAFIWLLAINLLSEVRAIVTGAVREASFTGERVARALVASEREWYRLREWLSRPAGAESAVATNYRFDMDISRSFESLRVVSRTGLPTG